MLHGVGLQGNPFAKKVPCDELPARHVRHLGGLAHERPADHLLPLRQRAAALSAGPTSGAPCARNTGSNGRVWFRRGRGFGRLRSNCALGCSALLPNVFNSCVCFGLPVCRQLALVSFGVRIEGVHGFAADLYPPSGWCALACHGSCARTPYALHQLSFHVLIQPSSNTNAANTMSTRFSSTERRPNTGLFVC